MKNASRFKNLVLPSSTTFIRSKLHLVRLFSEGKPNKERQTDSEKFMMDTQKLMQTVKSERLEVSTYKQDGNEEYTPEYFKMYSSKISDFGFLDEIPHNTEKDKIQYVYGMPVKNSIYKPRSQLIEVETMYDYDTATESLINLLELNKDSSYESLVLKFDREFNNGNS